MGTAFNNQWVLERTRSEDDDWTEVKDQPVPLAPIRPLDVAVGRHGSDSPSTPTDTATVAPAEVT